MRTTTRYLMIGLLTVAALGTSSARAAAESSCQDNGQVTVCAQGSVWAGDPAPDVPFGPLPDVNDLNDTGCVNQYGTYQNCNASH
jgi:hypothetical protein